MAGYMEDLRVLFKSTKDIIDKVRLGINNHPQTTRVGCRLLTNDSFEDDELFDLATETTFPSKDRRRPKKRVTQCAREEQIKSPPKDAHLSKITDIKNNTNNSNVCLHGSNESSVNLETSELEVSGYSVKVINRSQLDKLDVARGLSESLRELFLSSPEKISNSSQKLQFTNTSEVESLNESHNYETTNLSRAEYSDTNLNETFDFGTNHGEMTFNSEPSRPSHDSVKDASSAPSTDLESSVYLNNNESWSIYSTSENESNILSFPEEATNSGSCSNISEKSNSKHAAVSDVEDSDVRILHSYSIPSSSGTTTDASTFSESDATETRQCSSRKQTESSEAYQEFKHDIAFLAQCTNKMSTPEKSSLRSCSTVNQSSDFTSESYSEVKNIQAATSSESNSTEDHSYYSSDQTPESDTSTHESTHSTSTSSSSKLSEEFNSSNSMFTDDHFVHGVSPLCKENGKDSRRNPSQFHQRIVLANQQRIYNSSNKSHSRKHLSPSHFATLLRRSSPNVRRRIIFAHGGLRSGVQNIVKIASEKCGLITREAECEKSMNGFNTLSPENCHRGIVDKDEDDNIDTNKQTSPKCVFESETEEAVYYLITKYLENDKCPW